MGLLQIRFNTSMSRLYTHSPIMVVNSWQRLNVPAYRWLLSNPLKLVHSCKTMCYGRVCCTQRGNTGTNSLVVLGVKCNYRGHRIGTRPEQIAPFNSGTTRVWSSIRSLTYVIQSLAITTLLLYNVVSWDCIVPGTVPEVSRHDVKACCFLLCQKMRGGRVA